MKTYLFRRGPIFLFLLGITAPSLLASQTIGCDGTRLFGIPGARQALELEDGGIAAFSKLNINIDGYARAYHLRNAEAGALIHLCNAGRVYLPDGSFYEGSESNSTCTGQFMQDVNRIRAAGWNNPAVGVVSWYGILGRGSVKFQGRTILNIIPVHQNDGSGFFVSPTTLADSSIVDESDQSRYVNPLRISAAVVPRSLIRKGVAMGTFGVAYRVSKRTAVPFVVGDAGPRIGEGSVALARLAAGLSLKDEITRAERFAGQVDTADVLWIFFRGNGKKFDSRNETATMTEAKAAYEAWGGDARLQLCVRQIPRN